MSCWKINKKYANWKATLNKSEQILEETQRFSLKFLNKSKYSSRVWNMKQNNNYFVDCLIGLCRGVRVFTAVLFCSKWYGRAVEKGSMLSAGRLYHSLIIWQCCVKDAQAGSEKLVCALGAAQRCCLGSHHLHYQISAAFHLAEKQRFYLTTETSIQPLVSEQN